MKDKKFQVFVSSTFIDLKEERQAAVEAILSSGHIPAGMELFTAGDESQMTVIKRWIDESDIYLLILGGRYGSIEKKSGKSYTHLEYEYALSTNKPLFAVVISDNAFNEKVKAMGTKATENDNPTKLKEFKSEVLHSIIIKRFDDIKDIKIAIHETLAEFTYSKNLVGWIRGNNAVNTGFLAEEMARLTSENAELRTKLANTESNSNVLYSGLNYIEMEELLKNEPVKGLEFVSNLFEFIVMKGSKLVNGVSFWGDVEGDIEPILNKLAVYKIVSIRQSKMTLVSEGIFTTSGHEFYLKSTLLIWKQGRVNL